jgi:hypothetical protein
MTIFATLPGDVRRALARRELARRGAPAHPGGERTGEALDALRAALKALLPDEPPVFAEETEHVRSWAARQPPGHREKVDALAARIEAGQTTTADVSVLAALPADALAVLGLSAAGYVTWLHRVIDAV